MKRQALHPEDELALQRAARTERAAREAWHKALRALDQTIKQASRRGASLRAIALTIGRSHGRVRELLRRAPAKHDVWSGKATRERER